MSKVCSVLLYVASGFSFYMVSLAAFVGELPVAGKLAIMGVFAVLATGFLVLGLWTSRFSNWKRDIGVVLLSASSVTAFVALTFVCMIATPEVQQMDPDNKLASFSDYTAGASCIAFLALSGAFFIWYPQARNPPDKSQNPTWNEPAS